MEGFLFKKGRGDSIFGRHNWKQRWFVLEHGILNYYDSYNAKTLTPGTLKGTVDVNQAVVQEIEHSEKSNVFQITPLEGKAITLHSETEEVKQVWLDVIEFALEQQKIDQIRIEDALKIFGFIAIGDVTIEALDNAYQDIVNKNQSRSRTLPKNSTSSSKKASLASDSADSKDVQRAYKRLRLFTQQRIREFNFFPVTFECSIQRAGHGIDFGISVTEVDGEIVLTDIMSSSIKINSISSESKGKLMKGDIIIGVAKDSANGWTLNRLNQRLSYTLVPTGESINLTFQRYLPKSSLKQNFEDIKQVEEFYKPENTVGKFSTRRTSAQLKAGSLKEKGDSDITTKIGDLKLEKSGEQEEAFI